MPSASQRCSRSLPPAWRAAVLCLWLLAPAVLPLCAQEARWNELTGQTVQLLEQGKYAQAEAVAQEALQVAEATFGPDHPNLATSLNNLAAVYREEGKLAQAEPLYQRALRIREKIAGPEDAELARMLGNLAMLYDDEGRDAEAALLYQRALRIKESVLGPEHPSLAISLSGLALLYSRQGLYAAAEPLLQRALRIDEQAKGVDDPSVALDLSNLAGLYAQQGKYSQAVPLLERAIQIDERALGPDHPALNRPLNNLAEVYRALGRDAEAEPLYQRALHIAERAFGPGHPSVATDLNNLALFYWSQGKHTQAEELLDRALYIDENALGPEHPRLVTDLNNLATAYADDGKYEEADRLYQRALRMLEAQGSAEQPEFAGLLDNLALLRFRQASPAQAQSYYARAFDLLFRQFQYHFTYMSENDRLAFLATVSQRFPTYFSFVHRFQAQQRELTGDMYNLLLWQKGFIVGSVSSLRRQVEASGDPEALTLLDRLAAKRAQIAALVNARPPDPEARRRQMAQLEAEANDLEKALVARSAAFAQQKKLQRATWQQVRDALKPGEAAVEFARFPFFDGKQWTDRTYYVALVVTSATRDYPAYIVLGEGKQLEGAALVQFQQDVQTRGMEATPETGAAGPAPVESAYELFWRALEPALAGKKRVYLAPDGVLNQIPLGLIAAPGGKLLMERYDLRLVSSTKDLLRALPPPASATAVLIGDPAFDLSPAQQRAAAAELTAAPPAQPVQVAAHAPGERSRDQGVGTTLPRLPGTGLEIQAIARLLAQRHWQASSYTADRALEEAVKQARSPRLLHIATHGFFLPDQQIKRMDLGAEPPTGIEDPMLRSGLFFAGADRTLAGGQSPADLDDGVLTAYEATSLNLRGTELVVLSACNTGQGVVKNGEGVFGLRRALEEAGAQAVMMSLWSVPDQETQELMALFYGKWLTGTEKHEALREAQLQERAVVRKRYGRDLPYYWGAFVLVGR